MDWNNYLSEEKAPLASYAHLGVIDGTISGIFDLSKLPENAKIIRLSTPLKKFKLKYTNYETLVGNNKIEGIIVNDIDKERISIFSTMPNLKYLEISNNHQENIPDLSYLESVEVLILSNMTKVDGINFIKGMKNLKTLYIYGINNLYDLTPLSNLSSLRELSLHHGKMSGTGKAVKSMEPLKKLIELKYLSFELNVENKNYDIKPLCKLKNLEYLTMMPRYFKNGQKEILLNELPLIKNLK